MTPAKYKRDIQSISCVFTMLKNLENNGTEEIGLVTPTPGYLLKALIHFQRDSFSGIPNSVSQPNPRTCIIRRKGQQRILC